MSVVWVVYGSLDSDWHAVDDVHPESTLCGETFSSAMEGPLPIPRSPRCPKCSHAALNLKEAAEGKIHLFNVVMQHDVYVLAKSRSAALEAVHEIVRRGERPSDETVYNIANSRDIRNDWRDQQPFVSSDITDEEYSLFGDASTAEIFAQLYTKS